MPHRPSVRRLALILGAVAVASTAAAIPAQAAPTSRPPAHSRAQLAAARASLEHAGRLTGTAWAVVDGQVQVDVFDNAGSATAARVAALAKSSNGAISVHRSAGALTRRIAGGDAIYGGGYRCSLGFNVHGSDGTPYFLTAGHCGNLADSWYANGSRTALLGTVVGSTFPGNDYALVAYSSDVSDQPSAVDLYGGAQDISGAGDAYVGEYVTRSGSTTGVHSGTVTALDATVNYAEGTVYGLIRTTVCAEGGDSGGPLFDGSTAIGLTSGGSGNCRSGGTTYFQPVTAALNAYGVSIP